MPSPSSRPRPSWLFWSVCAAALGLLVLESRYTPPGVSETRLNSLPLSGPGFIGHNIAFNTAEVAFIGPAHALKRSYNLSGIPTTIILIDGTLNRHAVHDPSYCYKGMGYTILKEEALPINGGHGRLLKLEKAGEHRTVAFWFTDGHTHHASLPLYILQTALHRLTFGLMGEPPLLVMVEPASSTPLNWSTYLQKFPALTHL